MTRNYQYKVFADYHQFYLQDDDESFGDLSQAWTEEATERLLSVAPHAIGIRTARNSMVPITVTMNHTRPQIEVAKWDHIATASLQIDSGRIVVAGCTDYFPGAARIEVQVGVYEAIVCYANLDSMRPTGMEGEDSYHVHLFPGSKIQPATIKSRKRAK